MYLDPGFGSMVIQGLLAIVASVGVYCFTIKAKIIAFFSKKSAAPKTDAAENENAALSAQQADADFAKVEDDD